MSSYTYNFRGSMNWMSLLPIPALDLKLFYREAYPETGREGAPVLLLLHGFPSSSHQYRDLIPILATKFRVIAPDLPGFGFTEVPIGYDYTFVNLAKAVEGFLDALEIKKFSMYVFDYGAPTGFRVALSRPDAVQAIITQNGNAYEEGFGAFWNQVRALWVSRNDPVIQLKLSANLLTLDTTKWQYEQGTVADKVIAPESYTLDYALLQRPGITEAMLELLWDYRNNVAMYPQFQEYFRNSQVPLLAAWGKNDEIFIPRGAEAFKRDLPQAEVHLLDAGHFAVETETVEIGGLILDFLSRQGIISQ